jgi:hypothetical protein
MRLLSFTAMHIEISMIGSKLYATIPGGVFKAWSWSAR